MFVTVKAVIEKPKNFNPAKVDRRRVHIGKTHLFVASSGRPDWQNGVGEFVITFNGYGQPIDYQGVIVNDPQQDAGRCLIPVILNERCKFVELTPFNNPRDYQPVLYSFGNRLDQENGGDPVYLPVYLVTVWEDGRARIDKYLLDRDAIDESDHSSIVRVICEQIYFTNRLAANAYLLQKDLPKGMGGLAKYLVKAYNRMVNVWSDDLSEEKPKLADQPPITAVRSATA